jgi:hypothetical protein
MRTAVVALALVLFLLIPTANATAVFRLDEAASPVIATVYASDDVDVNVYDATTVIALNNIAPDGYDAVADSTVCHELMHAYTDVGDGDDPDLFGSCVWGDLLSPGCTDMRLMGERDPTTVANSSGRDEEPSLWERTKAVGREVGVRVCNVIPHVDIRFLWEDTKTTGREVRDRVSDILPDVDIDVPDVAIGLPDLGIDIPALDVGLPADGQDRRLPAIEPTASPQPSISTGAPAASPRAGCDPAYPEARTCIPPGPPFNQGCAMTTERNFLVLPPDPQRLDHDGDGIGCEPIPRRWLHPTSAAGMLSCRSTGGHDPRDNFGAAETQRVSDLS